MKILLLEDDMMLHMTIIEYLETVGHSVKGFREGESALNAIESTNYDLLILDINVPNIDGLTLLEKIYHKKMTIPTIFISALIDIEDISRAFELGCYDYLKKPFHLKELSLRIDKMLQMHHSPQEHTRLSDGYSFDESTMSLSFYNKPHILSNRQLQIIQLLAQYRGTVVSYDMLREYVWENYDIDNATIRAEVSRLKKSLQEDFIVNVRSLGYMIERVKSL